MHTQDNSEVVRSLVLDAPLCAGCILQAIVPGVDRAGYETM